MSTSQSNHKLIDQTPSFQALFVVLAMTTSAMELTEEGILSREIFEGMVEAVLAEQALDWDRIKEDLNLLPDAYKQRIISALSFLHWKNNPNFGLKLTSRIPE